MVEIAVVLAIVLGLAALVTPGVLGRIDRSRVAASAGSLRGIATAIHDPSPGRGSFKRHVGVYPGAVSHLTRPISTAQTSICGLAYTAVNTAGWNGPYLNRTAPATGIPIGIGVVRNAMTRDPASGGLAPVLRVHVDSVMIDDAGELDLEVDGVRDSTAGTVRWGAIDGEGFVTLDYLMPLKDC